jgi:4-amino-4-deoxy-L-arabinose transferase-like glycosyltransferase
LGHAGIGLVSIAIACLLSISLLVWKWRSVWLNLLSQVAERFARMSTSAWLITCFVAGLALRLLWVWHYPAPQQSDQATYFALGRGLVENHSYGFQHGGLAYWPPGFPFFLAIWFFLFGVKSWVPLVANLALYGGTLIVLDRIAKRIGGATCARLATLLLVPWPTLAMSAGFAGKEALVMFLICSLLLAFAWALESQRPNSEFAGVILTGGLLGAACLTQPSFLLFVFVLLLYDLMRHQNMLRAALRFLVTVIALSAVIFPWTLRNHRVLEAWILISTNGGDVFYRANNPLASGGYTPRGEQDLDGFDEIARGKVGFRLGKAWIRNHPLQFLKLGFRKEILFLGDDSQGAFETLKRGLGIGGLRYAAWKGISNLYWLLLWALILLALVVQRRSSLAQQALPAAVMLGVLYLFCIHSVFESGSKYHQPVSGFLAILAAIAVASPVSPRQSGAA